MTGRRKLLLMVSLYVGAVGLLPGHVRTTIGADRRGSTDVAASDGSSGDRGTGPPGGHPTPPEPERFTLVAAGDVLLHSPLWRQAESDGATTAQPQPGFDFRPLLAGVAPTVSAADLAICHLETPLAPQGGPYSGYPSFSVPPEIAPALAATGFDACSTASNHVFDQGASGVDRTLASLDSAGIDHAGSARNPEEAAAVTLLDAGDASVALLSYTYGFNGIPAPDGETWRAKSIDERQVLADAATARRRGADVVVVALHWGDEGRPEPNAQQEQLAPRLIASPDVDLLLGHHAHVVQPVQEIAGEWVVYGMGNMISYQGTLGPEKEEGLLVRFTFEETGQETEQETSESWHVTRAEYAPLLTLRGATPVRLVEVGRALDDPSLTPAQRARLQEAWDRTTAVVTQRGAPAAGLVPLATG